MSASDMDRIEEMARALLREIEKIKGKGGGNAQGAGGTCYFSHAPDSDSEEWERENQRLIEEHLAFVKKQEEMKNAETTKEKERKPKKKSKKKSKSKKKKKKKKNK